MGEKMEVQPLVSIIIPVYKVPEKLLRKCIESCIKQTLKNIEIVIVADYDSNPDDCFKICEEYKKQDARIVLLSGIKNGLSSVEYLNDR